MTGTSSSISPAIGTILASFFTRDWAWRALVALALNRSMKLCRCARSASCFTLALACSIRFSESCLAKEV